MAVTVSSSNTGTSSGHPSYSVTVAIPTPASGVADDYIIVHAQARFPRTVAVGSPDTVPVVITGDGGLGAPEEGVEQSDTITSGSASHSVVFAEWAGRRSAFTGGNVTFAKGPVSTSTGEMYVSITTIVVDDPGSVTGQATSEAASPGSVADPVGGVSDYCVAVAGSFSTGPSWSSGSFSTTATRTNTPTSGLYHSLIVGERTPWAAATYNAGFLGFARSHAFGVAPPPAVGGIFVDGAIHL